MAYFVLHTRIPSGTDDTLVCVDLRQAFGEPHDVTTTRRQADSNHDLPKMIVPTPVSLSMAGY